MSATPCDSCCRTTRATSRDRRWSSMAAPRWSARRAYPTRSTEVHCSLTRGTDGAFQVPDQGRPRAGEPGPAGAGHRAGPYPHPQPRRRPRLPWAGPLFPLRQQRPPPARTRDLQGGYLARSPYEYSHHIKIGFEFGVSEDEIRAMIDETEGHPTKLEPLAKLVLLGAREMTRDLAISDATFKALHAHLGEEHLLDLTITIAFYNAVVRVLATMQVDVEPDYQQYLEQFPLPAS